MRTPREHAPVGRVDFGAVGLGALPFRVGQLLRQRREVVEAIAPFEAAGGQARTARGEMVHEVGRHGIDGGGLSFVAQDLDLLGQAELQQLPGRVEDVRAPVAQRPGAVFVEAAPVAVDVVYAVGTRRTLALPHVPIQLGGRRFAAGHLLHRAVPLVPAARSAHEGVDARNVLQEALLHQRAALPVVAVGMALVAHLRDDLVLPRRTHHQLDLAEVVAQGLLAEHGLAQRHREHRRREVREVGRRDADGVDLRPQLVEHRAKVREARHLRIGLQHAFRVRGAHLRVAQRHDVHQVLVIDEHGEVAVATVADADERHVDLAVRRSRRSAQRRKGKNRSRRGRSQKLASLDVHVRNIIPNPAAGGNRAYRKINVVPRTSATPNVVVPSELSVRVMVAE